MPRTTLSLPQTWLLALEPHISEKRVQPRAPGPSKSDLWESPWLTHNTHKDSTVQGFPELQALRQSPTELPIAVPSHYSDKETQVPSPPPGLSDMSQDSTAGGKSEPFDLQSQIVSTVKQSCAGFRTEGQEDVFKEASP